MSKLIYKLPNSLGFLEISDKVISHMISFKQDSFLKKESGGQLFGSFVDNVIKVFEATGPNKKDKRSMFSFWPHRPTEQIEIHKKYTESGLHFVGDWHTHPENIPNPSSGDVASIKRMAEESKYDLVGIFMLILGRKEIPEGLYVGFYTSGVLYRLEKI